MDLKATQVYYPWHLAGRWTLVLVGNRTISTSKNKSSQQPNSTSVWHRRHGQIIHYMISAETSEPSSCLISIWMVQNQMWGEMLCLRPVTVRLVWTERLSRVTHWRASETGAFYYCVFILCLIVIVRFFVCIISLKYQSTLDVWIVRNKRRCNALSLKSHHAHFHL